MATIKYCNITVIGTSHSDVAKRVTEVLKALGEIRQTEDGRDFRVSINLSRTQDQDTE